ncbi:TPA_asm: N [Carrot gammacytorhabdovirus 1]|nr:TPA_asm: N [Carrot gammacytorhabdovirus 1]
MAVVRTNTTMDLTNFAASADYAAVQNIVPSLRDQPSQNWDHDTMFGTVRIYSGASLDRAQAEQIGRTWLEDLNNTTISTRTAYKGLRLAMSLRPLNERGDEVIVFQQDRRNANDPDNNNLGIRENFPNLNDISGEALIIRQPRAPLTDPNIALQEGEAGNAAVGDVDREFITVRNANAPEDNEVRRVTAYSFLAAYLMKLIVRDPGTVVTGLQTMKNRFENFYGVSTTIANFELTLQQAQTYKDALTSSGMIGSTYTHAIAYTHNEMMNRLDDKEKGMLSYLAFIQFSYTGLHALNLMTQLQQKTNVPLNVLMTMFKSDVTSAALTCMTHVFSQLERTPTNLNRPLTHRYCTHWGQHYFVPLRTKQCPYLAYTLAHALGSVERQEGTADASRIVGAQHMSLEMKRTLARAGQIIGNTLKSRMFGGTGASAAYALAIQETRVPEEDEDDEEDDEDYEDYL